MNYLSLDVGTTCCKCQLFSEKGEILEYKNTEYPLKQAEGELYVDIAAIRGRVFSMISEVAAKREVSSVCISTFGESFVLLDKNDEILFDPMLYTDARGAEQAEMISEKFTNEYLFQNLGSLPQSLFSVSKLLWLKQNRPEIFARADKAMLICDYLGYLLTGERAIDYALASRTGAFHIGKLTFDEDFLNELGVPVSLFSTPMPTGSIVGMIKKRVAKDLGLSEHCMLVLGSHDQICAALGAGVVKEGDAVDGMGTVECITTVFSKKPSDCTMGEQGYPCVPYAVKGLYCTYMFNYSNGSLVSWFKDELLHGYRGNEENFFSYIEKDMKRAPTGILTLPYFGGAATPYQNIHAKGAILNLTLRATDRDVYRSVMEGTAMEMRLNLETASAYGIKVTGATATGGGANSGLWLQAKADIENIPFRTLRSSEGGLCGCAMLQSVAMGQFADLEEAAKLFVQYREEFFPDADVHAAYEEQYSKYKKLYQTLKEFY